MQPTETEGPMATRLELSLSCGFYDRTLPILTGLVKPEGVDLLLPPLRRGSSMGSPDADVYETPLPRLIIEIARGHTHAALPIFPKRTFFHQLILTTADSRIRSFEDFRGKRIGLLHWYQHAMGVWLRGHLQDAPGIAPAEMEWFTERPDLVPWSKEARVRLIPPGKSLVEMLLVGQLDLLVHEAAHTYLLQYPGLRRVFPASRILEVAYYRETGCFPINHVLAVRKDLVERYPWLAARLREAFDRAQEMALDQLDRTNAFVSTPWMDGFLEEQYRTLGRDLFPNGVEENRRQLETLVRYMHQQGFIPRPLALEEIFLADEAGGGPNT